MGIGPNPQSPLLYVHLLYLFILKYKWLKKINNKYKNIIYLNVSK